LKQIKQNNFSDIDKLTEENKKFNKIIREDESIIKNMENERTRLLNINSELKLEIKELTKKLKNREETFVYQNKKIQECNANIDKMDKTIKDLEAKNSDLKIEIRDKIIINQKDSKLLFDKEKDIELLNKIILEKDYDGKKLLDDIEYSQTEKNKLYEDNSRMFNEMDRLKNHIYTLTDMNQQVN